MTQEEWQARLQESLLRLEEERARRFVPDESGAGRLWVPLPVAESLLAEPGEPVVPLAPDRRLFDFLRLWQVRGEGELFVGVFTRGGVARGPLAYRRVELEREAQGPALSLRAAGPRGPAAGPPGGERAAQGQALLFSTWGEQLLWGVRRELLSLTGGQGYQAAAGTALAAAVAARTAEGPPAATVATRAGAAEGRCSLPPWPLLVPLTSDLRATLAPLAQESTRAAGVTCLPGGPCEPAVAAALAGAWLVEGERVLLVAGEGILPSVGEILARWAGRPVMYRPGESVPAAGPGVRPDSAATPAAPAAQAAARRAWEEVRRMRLAAEEALADAEVLLRRQADLAARRRRLAEDLPPPLRQRAERGPAFPPGFREYLATRPPSPDPRWVAGWDRWLDQLQLDGVWVERPGLDQELGQVRRALELEAVVREEEALARSPRWKKAAARAAAVRERLAGYGEQEAAAARELLRSCSEALEAARREAAVRPLLLRYEAFCSLRSRAGGAPPRYLRLLPEDGGWFGRLLDTVRLIGAPPEEVAGCVPPVPALFDRLLLVGLDPWSPLAVPALFRARRAVALP